MFGLGAKTEESSKDFAKLIGFIGTGAIATEQVMAVNKVRQRLQEKSPSVSAYSFEKKGEITSYGINQEAVKQLRKLKEKHEAHEISEEEFKMQKQRILESL